MVIAVKHDIATEKEWAHVFAKTMEKFGKVDILVNNAGMPGKTHENVWDIDTTETMRIVSVNLVGTLLAPLNNSFHYQDRGSHDSAHRAIRNN